MMDGALPQQSIDQQIAGASRRRFRAVLLSRRSARVVVFLIGLAALAGAFIYGGMAAQQRRAANQDLYAHTLEVMSVTRQVLSEAQDLEIGHRGFLLTGDREFLEPYLRANEEIDADLATLKDLVSDNPRQAALVGELSSLVGRLREKLRTSVGLGETGQLEAAADGFSTDSSKPVMDATRDIAEDLLAQEEVLLIERRTASRDGAVAAAWYLLGLAVLGLALIVFAIYSAYAAVSSSVRADMQAERAAAALRHAAGERRFRTMTEAMPQIVWAANSRGEFDFVNAKWRDFTGAQPTPETWVDHIHPDDRAGVAKDWRHSLATAETYQREVRMRGADGGYRWFLCRAVPLRNAAGEVEAWLGAGTDIHEARLNLEARELISHELSHRIKNIFSVIGSLVALSARSDPSQAAFAASLRSRIFALARAHEFVRPHSPESAARTGPRTFAAFIRELLSAYADENGARVAFAGEDFTFGDKSATALALFFHELGTNAAKYGALSTPAGQVAITATRSGDRMLIEWRERGGPPIAKPPEREGFGATLARLSIEGQLDGALARAWEPDGLVVTVRIPMSVLAQA